MPEFINEFKVKNQVTELGCYSVQFKLDRESQPWFVHKIAAHVASKLSTEMKTPIAAAGTTLNCESDVKLNDVITITVKIDGKPTDIDVKLEQINNIKKGDPEFNDAVKRFLNRKADLILLQNKYQQDQRNFFENKVKPAGQRYGFRQGIQINAHVSEDGFQTIIIDPVTEVRNKMDLRQALFNELVKLGIEKWKEVTKEQEEEINKQFRTKGDNIRTTYTEQKGDNVTHNRYRFVGFDFGHGLTKNDDPTNPVNFHTKYGRTFEMDQPIVKLVARGGFEITHIPELLEEVPSLHVMKRFGASQEIQARSLMQANDRYYMTSALLKPLVKEELIEETPTVVNTENFGPVQLTLKGDYIEIKTNQDFQQIYEKKKLLLEPKIKTINIFSTSKDEEHAQRFLKVLVEIFNDFGLVVPELKTHSDCPDSFAQFGDYIVDIAKKENYAEQDLVLAVFKPSREDTEDNLYNKIKATSLENLFPVQFIESPQIAKKNGNQLRTSLANPIFLQIVAKCMGQPYGLQEGFVPMGTVFVGIDRYRDPFKSNAPLITAVVVFDEFGGYICSATNIAPDEKTVPSIKSLLEKSLKEYVSVKKRNPKLVLYMLDTGPGTMEEQLLAEAKECEEISSSLKAEFVYLSANKGSRLRLYYGDPKRVLTAKRVGPFTAVTKMRDSREILVVATEPIISHEKGKEIGMPRTMLYKILQNNYNGSQDELKQLIAKSIIWLCKHAWISPAATRLPAPLFFANKVSRLTGSTGKMVNPDRSKAPLYL